MAIYNGGLNIIAPDISGKEDKSNKVTAWSSTTTDEHYPSEKLVKDALDTKVNTADALSYEEILATNPVPDLTNKVASASVLKTLSDKLSGFTVLKASTIYGTWNIDDLDGYPKGTGILHFTGFIQPNATGTLPFPDGHLLTFIWRNDTSENSILTQLAIEDEGTVTIKMRSYDKNAKAWQAWKKIWVEGDRITGAVFNDLADAIPVGEGDVLEAGYCYGFDGEHYTKTSEYMQKSYIGIHSDTYGFKMGHEKGKEKLNVAISGFVLAYVDKEYEVGTPLTCTSDGHLTEIKLEDKIKYPERVVATYWKSEPNEEWGPEGDKVKVKGRRWVKVK